MKLLSTLMCSLCLLPSFAVASMPVPLVNLSSVDACNNSMEKWENYSREQGYYTTAYFFEDTQDVITRDQALKDMGYLNGVQDIGFGWGSLCSAFGHQTSVYVDYTGDTFQVAPDFWPTVRNLVTPLIEQAVTQVMTGSSNYPKVVKLTALCKVRHGGVITSKGCSIGIS